MLGLKHELPPTPPDTDQDGFLDPADSLPDRSRHCARTGRLPTRTRTASSIRTTSARPSPAVAPDGCPDRDPDKGRLPNPDDKCRPSPVAPDGCPDQIRTKTASASRATDARTSGDEERLSRIR